MSTMFIRVPMAGTRRERRPYIAGHLAGQNVGPPDPNEGARSMSPPTVSLPLKGECPTVVAVRAFYGESISNHFVHPSISPVKQNSPKPINFIQKYCQTRTPRPV